jgi:hypothetical protein
VPVELLARHRLGAGTAADRLDRGIRGQHDGSVRVALGDDVVTGQARFGHGHPNRGRLHGCVRRPALGLRCAMSDAADTALTTTMDAGVGLLDAGVGLRPTRPSLGRSIAGPPRSLQPGPDTVSAAGSRRSAPVGADQPQNAGRSPPTGATPRIPPARAARCRRPGDVLSTAAPRLSGKVALVSRRSVAVVAAVPRRRASIVRVTLRVAVPLQRDGIGGMPSWRQIARATSTPISRWRGTNDFAPVSACRHASWPPRPRPGTGSAPWARSQRSSSVRFTGWAGPAP